MTKIELNKKYFKENKRVPTNKKVQYLIRYFKNDKNIPNSSEFVYDLSIESINHLYDSTR
jgi:hypothetical protein|tara:strand:+ start:175 stop:354 length:180 start_codon:yes stop_codon:yes gene_type:complete